MTPTISSQFTLATKKLRVTDTFNYTTLPYYGGVYGNVTAKIGNSVFHTNDQFDSNADIVIGTNTYIDIDLPTSSGKIQEGSYTVDYDLLVKYASDVTPPGSSTFTQLTLSPSSQDLIDEIQSLLDSGKTPTIIISGSGVIGTIATSQITAVSGDDIVIFNSVTAADFAEIDTIVINGEYSVSKEYLFSNCEVVSQLSLNTLVNCFTAQITVQDTTAYPSFVETLTRTLTLRYPRLADGSEVEAPVETSNASLTVGPYIWSGGYSVTLQSVMTWVQTDGLIISQTLVQQANPNVACDVSLCKAAKCIRTLSTKYLEAVKAGSRNLSDLFQQNFTVLLLCNNYNLALTCQDTAAATEALAALTSYLNIITGGECNCGCTGGTSTEPTRIYPLFSNETLINGIENVRNYQ